MKILKRFVEAGRKTLENLDYYLRTPGQIHSHSYYDKKDIEFCEFVALIQVPIEYVFELFGKSYWKSNKPQIY